MSNKKKSNKRQIKVPAKYNDHIVGNLSQKRTDNENIGKKEEIRVSKLGKEDSSLNIEVDGDGTMLGGENLEDYAGNCGFQGEENDSVLGYKVDADMDTDLCGKGDGYENGGTEKEGSDLGTKMGDELENGNQSSTIVSHEATTEPDSNNPMEQASVPLPFTKEAILSLNNGSLTFEQARALFNVDLSTLKARLLQENIFVWNEFNFGPLRIHGVDGFLTLVIKELRKQ